MASFKFLLAVFVFVVCQASAVSAGRLYFSYDRFPGLFLLDTNSGAATPVGASGTTNANVGLAPHPNSLSQLYGSTFSELVEINRDGSGANSIGVIDRDGLDGAEGLAYDASRSVLYGAMNSSFYTINPVTGVASSDLARPFGDVEGIAWDGADTIYGIVGGFTGPNQGVVFAYDIPSNTWDFVLGTGIRFNNAGLAYDATANVLYAIGSQDSNLYRIDPILRRTTIVGDVGLPRPGGGLAFVVPEPGSLLLTFGIAGALVAWRRRQIA